MAKRSTIIYSNKINTIITDLADKEDTTKSDIIRRAIALYNRLYKLSREEDGDILAVTSSGESAVSIHFG